MSIFIRLYPSWFCPSKIFCCKHDYLAVLAPSKKGPMLLASILFFLIV